MFNVQRSRFKVKGIICLSLLFLLIVCVPAAQAQTHTETQEINFLLMHYPGGVNRGEVYQCSAKLLTGPLATYDRVWAGIIYDVKPLRAVAKDGQPLKEAWYAVMTKDGWIIPMRGYNLGGAENVIEFSYPSIAVIRAFMREAGAKESEEGKRE
jgi:hypothetical protein